MKAHALTRASLPTFGTLALGALLLASSAGAQGVSGGKLPTRWDAQVSPTNPLPDYPRPQMTRAQWQSLNGPWDYALTDGAVMTPPAAYSGKILVPYPLESALSGVQKPSAPTQRLWYRRAFTVPSVWKGKRVLLHFGAVNWDSTVTVNGKDMGEHKGGYDPFRYDITDALQAGPNTLVVSAQNPLIADKPDAQVLGKQRLKPSGIFYTAATGIWQSVWLEPVPAAYISALKITPDIDAQTLKLTVSAGADGLPVSVTATDGGKIVAKAQGTSGTEITIPLPSPHLWSPDDPHLYSVHIALAGKGADTKGADAVDSYFAMRKISLGKDAQGRTRILLNNKFVFQVGALDQGYWPDGIYTAPTDDALKYDIQVAKNLGYNLLRKHAKVEPDRWYYWTDKLGMLVWQDMPQAFGDNFTDTTKEQWLTEWRSEIAAFYNHPSIIVWTTFNEGWGQHDTEAIVALTKQLDPTRLVNNASGWNDKGVGDLRDTHAYPGPWSELPEPTRAAVNGEFGGVTLRIPDHMWTTEVMGYGTTLKGSWKATKNYQQLLKNAYGLRDERGTSAVVYTQITDVEQESNGILTYDRAVTKMDPAIVRAANQGVFLPLPPNPNPNTDLVATSEDDPYIWQYMTAKPAEDWTQPTFDASAWKSGPAPFGHDADNVRTQWTDTPGDIWMRREITLPAGIPAKLVVLARHDEDVEVYVNGVLAASEAGYKGDYARLPLSEAARAAMHPGKNILAVHCHQTVGGQVIDVGIAQNQIK
jgi:hypothetical protein